MTFIKALLFGAFLAVLAAIQTNAAPLGSLLEVDALDQKTENFKVLSPQQIKFISPQQDVFEHLTNKQLKQLKSQQLKQLSDQQLKQLLLASELQDHNSQLEEVVFAAPLQPIHQQRLVLVSDAETQVLKISCTDNVFILNNI